MSKENLDKDDVFQLNRIYDDATNLFKLRTKSFGEMKDSCVFVVDTNVLLMPYTVGSDSFEDIKKIFSKLIEQNRLFIPEQVAREFVKNRPKKINDIYTRLDSNKCFKGDLGVRTLNFLKNEEGYSEIEEIEEILAENAQKYSCLIKSMQEKIRGWGTNDPISLAYGDLFNDSVIRGASEEKKEEQEEDVLAEVQRRNKYHIPPGFQDSNKQYNCAGDLLIWLTMINIAKTEKKDVIFVSNDVKNDWCSQSAGKPLCVRFELLYEFGKETNGFSFNSIRLSDLLMLFKANESVVQDVKVNELKELTEYSDANLPVDSLEDISFSPNYAVECVYRYLLDEGGEVLEGNGTHSVDFEIYKDGQIEGVNIKVFRLDSLVPNYIVQVISDEVGKFNSLIRENQIDKGRLFIVIDSIVVPRINLYLDLCYLSNIAAGSKIKLVFCCLGNGSLRIIRES